MNFIELLSKLIEKLSIKKLMISLAVVIVFTFVPNIDFLAHIVLLSQTVKSFNDINIPMFLASLIVVFVVIEFIQWLYFMVMKLKDNYNNNIKINEINKVIEADDIVEINAQNILVRAILKKFIIEDTGYISITVNSYIEKEIEYIHRKNWISIMWDTRRDTKMNEYSINLKMEKSRLNGIKKLYERKLILQDVDLDNIPN